MSYCTSSFSPTLFDLQLRAALLGLTPDSRAFLIVIIRQTNVLPSTLKQEIEFRMRGLKNAPIGLAHESLAGLFEGSNHAQSAPSNFDRFGAMVDLISCCGLMQAAEDALDFLVCLPHFGLSAHGKSKSS